MITLQNFEKATSSSPNIIPNGAILVLLGIIARANKDDLPKALISLEKTRPDFFNRLKTTNPEFFADQT
ncbi:MAG TPA: hypothetical protein P5230_01015 [Candidatus Magasanikbacteria bacterium]|nr:hypothetical protein [Candidatus Magasanikbacteria bacterium]